jgi:hypothetical protein
MLKALVVLIAVISTPSLSVNKDYLKIEDNCNGAIKGDLTKAIMSASSYLSKNEFFKKYQSRTNEDSCRILSLRENVVSGKKNYCEKNESPIDCMAKIQDEIDKNAPLTSTGIIMYMSASALVIFKEKKNNMDGKEFEDNEKFFKLIYYTKEISKASLVSMQNMKSRFTPEKIYPNVKPMKLNEIDGEAIIHGLKNEGENKELETRFPYIKNPAFNLAILKLLDDILVLKFLKTAYNKNWDLMITSREKILEKLEGRVGDERYKIIVKSNEFMKILIEYKEMKKHIDTEEKRIGPYRELAGNMTK